MSLNSMRDVKVGLVAFVVFIALSGCASVGTDKLMHFGASGIISALVTCLSEPEQSIALGAAAGLGAGFAKEIYDSRPGGSGFNGADLLADGLGAGAGTAIGYGVCHNPNVVPR